MLVLSEGIAQDQQTTSEKLLVDLGVNVPRVGNHNIPKKAPHEKYYWFRCKFHLILIFIFIGIYNTSSPHIN